MLELACWGAECMALMLSGHVRVRCRHVSVLLMELCALLLAVDACTGC